jgi:5-methylcytosine-specific restriction endonuclease McrA
MEMDHQMNRWAIPEWLENEVRERDRKCVYCRIPMIELPAADGSRRSVATWEHIINDASIVTPENIVRCCASCNSSKGTKELSVWIESSYCKQRGIGRDTVADVVKQALSGEA